MYIAKQWIEACGASHFHFRDTAKFDDSVNHYYVAPEEQNVIIWIRLPLSGPSLCVSSHNAYLTGINLPDWVWWFFKTLSSNHLRG